MPYRQPMRHDQIALQLYTVRRLTAGPPGHAAGRRRCRLSGGRARGPARRRRRASCARLLDEAGLRAVASHEGIEALREDVERRGGSNGRARLLPGHRAVDARGGPRGPPTTSAASRAELGGFAGVLAERGIRLGYHNHAFEFAPLDGTTIWDVLLAELPPEVEIELDVYWAAVGGRDPVAEIRATADRVRLLHMKDRAAGPEPRDAPAGEGILAFPGIVDAARAAGVEWYIVEQDEPRQALADIAQRIPLPRVAGALGGIRTGRVGGPHHRRLARHVDGGQQDREAVHGVERRHLRSRVAHRDEDRLQDEQAEHDDREHRQAATQAAEEPDDEQHHGEDHRV